MKLASYLNSTNVTKQHYLNLHPICVVLNNTNFDCHNSYFLSPQFPIILATWLSQLVNHSSTQTRALHGQSLGNGLNFGNDPKFIFFLPNHITQLSSLSYSFLQFWQRYCRNSVSLLILLNNFEQCL